VASRRRRFETPQPLLPDCWEDAGVEDRPQTIARGEGVHGELALRRRGAEPAIYELIVNGVFLMDSAETSTERLLAEAVLVRHADPRRILVGGLGLGFTVTALLEDRRVERVDVVEIEPLLVEWLRSGLVPGADDMLRDPRVQVQVGDVLDVLAGAPAGPYDGILLDVDNGPGFLVHDANAAVYETAALRDARAALRDGGLLAVWSAAPAKQLERDLAANVGRCDVVTADLVREGRPMTYYLYLAHPPPR
jgi:spermidine synthase